MEADLLDELAELNDLWEERAHQIETVEIGLEKNDVSVDEVACAGSQLPSWDELAGGGALPRLASCAESVELYPLPRDLEAGIRVRLDDE